MKELIKKGLSAKVKSVNESTYEIDFIFSTPDVDRQGEIIDQSGWKLEEFQINPVVLFVHDHYQPAVGQVTRIEIVNGLLEGTVKFAAEEYDFAMTLFKLYAGRYMRAVSVGFDNLLIEFNQENDQVILKENVLYELSLVNVPGNALALAKSKGLDVSPIEKLQEEVRARQQKVLVEKMTKDFEKKIEEGIKKNIKLRADTRAKNNKVETPNATGSLQGHNRKINAVVRKLLRDKKTL